MKMKFILSKGLTIFVVLMIFNGCAKEATGDLAVSVTVNGFTLGTGAKVYTNPPSVQGNTDQFGSILFNDVEAGSYEVFADIAGVGSGKSFVKIEEDKLNSVFVNIIPGVNVNIAPQITLILPSEPAEFAFGDNITFSAQLADDKTEVTSLSVEWKSDKDGVLNTQGANADGVAGFTTNQLSRNDHSITLKVTDKDGFTNSATIRVNTLAPAGIELISAQKTGGKIELEWTKYPGSDFLKYEVFRADANCDFSKKQLLSEITDINNTRFVDLTPALEYQSCYFIRVTNQQGKARNSNDKLVELPGGHLFNFIPYDMLVHPDKEFVYLVDLSGQKLIKYNYSTGEVDKEREIPSVPGYCDIGDNGIGLEIYVPANDGFIYIYDADNLTFVGSITTGLFTMSVISLGNGYIAAALAPSPWWDGPIRTYKRSNGLLIDSDGDFERSRMRKIPGKNEILTISTTVSPVDLDYYKLNGDGLFLEHQNDTYHGDHPLDATTFRIANSGNYMVTGYEGAVYLANASMQYKGTLQRGALNFSDFAFSDDGSTMYAGTSNRRSIQVGKYPSLLRENEILTRGFPVIIERKADKIISVSKRQESDIVTGIEVIQL